MSRKNKNAPQVTQMDGKTEEGIVYLSSIPYGDRRTTKVTADKLVKYAKNVYGAGVTHKQRNLIFQEKYKIRVLDPDQESNPELENRLTLMCDQKGVRLWPALQLAWYDAFWFGMSLFNPVWGYEGNEYVLQKLRHLPPESFGTQPYGRTVLFSDVLKGVVISPEDPEVVEYWQTLNPMDISTMPSEISAKMLQKKLQNIFTVKDPVSTELAGSPTIIPIIPLLTMLDFAWQAQVQKVNRTGAPLMFMKIINPTGDDIRYGQSFLNNWGKNSGMQLRANMEIIVPDLKDTSSALETIEALNKMIVDYFSPTSMLNSSGAAAPMSGSSNAEQELLYAYVRGIHSWISEAFEQLLQVYLDANAYEGYTVHIDIPSPSIDKSDLWLKQATEGARNGSLMTNEIRSLLEASELDEDGLAALRADVAARAPPALAQSPAMAQAELAIKAMSVDKLDPYGITGPQGKRLVQTVLGIENGEEEQPPA
jgi:hypothetical protein